MQCPCGSNKDFTSCCQVFISGQQLPSSPEELMRSRYTAYTQHNTDYISNTMKSPAADHFDAAGAREWSQRVEWLKLEIIESSVKDDKGFVEFIAHMSMDKKRQVLHELSEFHLINGQWFYVDGKDPRAKAPVSVARVGRNDPCLCGSGNKYKKCCGK